MEIVTHVRSLFALAAATVIASATTALAQATDHCADAPNLTADGSYPFDLTGATADGIPGSVGCAHSALG